jgi:hypothetical protein
MTPKSQNLPLLIGFVGDWVSDKSLILLLLVSIYASFLTFSDDSVLFVSKV